MLNGVVATITRALAARGVVALRFNFRGVARSGGRYDGGRGEQADVAGALDWLLDQPEVDPQRLSVVGYSFGAWVGLSQAQTDPRVAAVAAAGLVAWREEALSSAGTALNLGRFAPDFLQRFRKPKLFVSGEHDGFVSQQALRGLVDRLPPPKELHLLPGTDHFFVGREREVGELVAGFVVGL
jgi:alpha/beta superfamily hydrolase